MSSTEGLNTASTGSMSSKNQPCTKLHHAALGIFKSPVAPNRIPVVLSTCFIRFTCCSILPSASVAGGVSRPRSGALYTSTITGTTAAPILQEVRVVCHVERTRNARRGRIA
eukprot:TRINITY_DN524_c0_g1_i2.p1 TRINITY_DN524_c0_g1~~TRINITY_DN524_c0_g1_i2.p1  ORF type:complete len:112 (+),score=6.24 TRINITY_DN524_c0_g1_i2:2-337(+)